MWDRRRPGNPRGSRIHRGRGVDRGCDPVGGSEEHRPHCNLNAIRFSKGVVRLVCMRRLCVQSNFYSTLVTMKDERDLPIFEVLEARAACDECIEKLDDPSQCPHMQLERPKWYARALCDVVAQSGLRRKSKEKQQVVKALYSGNKMMMMRESLGIVTEGQGGVFSTKCVKQLFDRVREKLPKDTQHVYIAIDPTGGGPSKFAIVSGIRFNGKLQVSPVP